MWEDVLTEDVVQNLKDAGCDAAQIERFMECIKTGKTDEGLGILEDHRNGLLDRIHIEERQISCLDYLVYRIRQKQESGEEN